MSAAEQHFRAAIEDVNTLMQFHEVHGGRGPGRRDARLQALNKSAIVLLCAAWETYIESVLTEAAERSIANAEAPDQLIDSISRLVAKGLKKAEREDAWHELAGEGWKGLARAAVASAIGVLNTPKTAQVKGLFRLILEINDIDASWTWQKTDAQKAGERLDEFVGLRGGIAHGDRAVDPVLKRSVVAAVDLITRLVGKVEERLTAEGHITPALV